jgi:FeS assembly SUF system protein
MSEETRQPDKTINNGQQTAQENKMIEEGSPIAPVTNADGGNEPARQPSKSPTVEDNDPVLEQKIVAALRTCFDPEIPVNIYELGLIYKIQAPNPEDIKITMTLTSPMCPVAESLPVEVEQKIRAIPNVKIAQVDLTWEPPWNPQMMSEAAKLQLNLP